MIQIFGIVSNFLKYYYSLLIVVVQEALSQYTCVVSIMLFITPKI